MLKNKFKKIIINSIICLTSLTIFGSVASATTFSGTLKSGVNRPVWYSPSVASYGYTSHFDAGRDYWNRDTKVNLWKWDQANNSTDRYYVGTSYPKDSDDGELNVDGAQSSYKVTSTGAVVEADKNEDWNFSVVTIYHNALSSPEKNYARELVNEVTAHEIGHSIKMAHSLGTYSPNSSYADKYGYLEDTIMHPSKVRKLTSIIRPYDQKEVERKWGY